MEGAVLRSVVRDRLGRRAAVNPLKTWSRKDPATGESKRVYVIDFFYVDPSGRKRRYRRDARVQTKAAGEAESRRLYLAAVATGVVPGADGDDGVAETFTFNDAVTLWRAHWVKKHSTRCGYDVNLDAHLVPRFGHRRLDSIGYADVAGLRAALAGVATSTANNVETALRSVLRTAVAHEKLTAMPKLPPLRKVHPKIIVPPSVGDLETVLAAAYPAAKVALGLAAYAGLRAGEITALRFRDVDAKAKVIRVRAAVSHGVEGAPKSGHERAIPIAEPLLELLAPVLAKPHKPDEYVSTSTRGRQWGAGSIRHAFNRVMKAVQLPKKRLHDLRHFFVTECFRAGVPAPDVQKLAGHLHLHVTQRYAHADDASQREAMRRFDAHLAATAKASSGNGVETTAPTAPEGEPSKRTNRPRSRAKRHPTSKDVHSV
jgi:integrase